MSFAILLLLVCLIESYIKIWPEFQIRRSACEQVILVTVASDCSKHSSSACLFLLSPIWCQWEWKLFWTMNHVLLLWSVWLWLRRSMKVSQLLRVLSSHRNNQNKLIHVTAVFNCNHVRICTRESWHRDKQMKQLQTSANSFRLTKQAAWLKAQVDIFTKVCFLWEKGRKTRDSEWHRYTTIHRSPPGTCTHQSADAQILCLVVFSTRFWLAGEVMSLAFILFNDSLFCLLRVWSAPWKWISIVSRLQRLSALGFYHFSNLPPCLLCPPSCCLGSGDQTLNATVGEVSNAS